MWKIGDLAAHYLTSNKVGRVVDIVYEKSNAWLTGGTAGVKVILLVEYPDKVRQNILTGDAMKIYK